MKRILTGGVVLALLGGLVWWTSSSPKENQSNRVTAQNGDASNSQNGPGLQVSGNTQREMLLAMLASGVGIKSTQLSTRIKEILVFDATLHMDANRANSKVVQKMNEAGVTMALLQDENDKPSETQQSSSLIRENPMRFMLGAPKMTGLWTKSADTYADTLKEQLQAEQIHSLGEIYLHYNCQLPEENEPVSVDPDSPAVHAIAKLAAERNVPLFIHYEPMKEGSHLRSLKQLLSSEPETTFIWAHAGWETATTIGDLFAQHPNLYATLAKRIGPGQLCDQTLQARVAEQREILTREGRLKKEWRKLLRAHEKRFLFASDADASEVLGEAYIQQLDKLRYAIALDLKPRQIRRILHINAIRLFAPDVLKEFGQQKVGDPANIQSRSDRRKSRLEKKKQDRLSKPKPKD